MIVRTNGAPFVGSSFLLLTIHQPALPVLIGAVSGGACFERAADPLHRIGGHAKLLGDLPHAGSPRSRQGLTDAFFERGAIRGRPRRLVVGYFENLVSKMGRTQNISPSFRSSHSTSLGDASPITVRSTSRKPGRLRRADKAADWSDIATR